MISGQSFENAEMKYSLQQPKINHVNHLPLYTIACCSGRLVAGGLSVTATQDYSYYLIQNTPSKKRIIAQFLVIKNVYFKSGSCISFFPLMFAFRKTLILICLPGHLDKSSCGSASMRKPLFPSFARPAPKSTVVVVLPTPPFGLALAIALLFISRLFCATHTVRKFGNACTPLHTKDTYSDAKRRRLMDKTQFVLNPQSVIPDEKRNLLCRKT